jgi:hypothetical protein
MSVRSVSSGVFGVALVVQLLAPVAGAADPPRLGDYQLLGTSRCAWEPQHPGSFYYRPDIQDAASCQQFVTQQGKEFIAETGDGAWLAAAQPPTADCTCESKTERWFFNTSWQYCMGVAYSCTKPGSGCKWGRAGSTSVDVETMAACRSSALSSGGTYLGWAGGDAASKAPECSCVCGESRTQWYAESNASTDWRLLCRGVKYSCMGPPILTKVPQKVLDSLRVPTPTPRP